MMIDFAYFIDAFTLCKSLRSGPAVVYMRKSPALFFFGTHSPLNMPTIKKKAGSRRRDSVRATGPQSKENVPPVKLYNPGFFSPVGMLPKGGAPLGRPVAEDIWSPVANWSIEDPVETLASLPSCQPDQMEIPSPWFNEYLGDANVRYSIDVFNYPLGDLPKHADEETEKALFTKLSSRYVLVKFLGAGANGAAYVVRKPRGRKQIVMKVAFDYIRNGGSFEGFEVEALTQKKLKRFDNVLKYISHEELDGHFLIFSELANGGDLLQKILKTKARLPVKESKSLLFECALALAACEKDGIIHGDVKPDNFFIHNGRVQLGDFGTCMPYPEVYNRELSTPFFRAPEVLNASCPLINTKIDSWSLGITMLFVLTGKLIKFDGEKDLAEQLEALMPKKRMSKALKDLLTRIFRHNPEERLTALEIVNHAYFDQIRCDDTYAKTLRQLRRRR